MIKKIIFLILINISLLGLADEQNTILLQQEKIWQLERSNLLQQVESLKNNIGFALDAQDKMIRKVQYSTDMLNILVGIFGVLITLGAIFITFKTTKEAKIAVKEYLENKTGPLLEQIKTTGDDFIKDMSKKAERQRIKEQEKFNKLYKLNGNASIEEKQDASNKAQALKSTDNKSVFDLSTLAIDAFYKGNLEQAIKYFQEVINFSGVDDVELAQALLNSGIALGGLGKIDEELESYNTIIDKFGDSNNEQLKLIVAQALVDKGVALGETHKHNEAISIFDIVINKFINSNNSDIKTQVAKAMVDKGIMLGHIAKIDEALVVFGSVINQFSSSAIENNYELSVQVAKSMFNKAILLGQMGDFDNSITTFDVVINKFKDSKYSILLEQVAQAIINKGVILGQMNEYQNAINTFNLVINLFANNTNILIQLHIAEALFNKAATFGQLNNVDDAIGCYNDLLAKFSDSSNENIQNIVADSKTELAKLNNN